MPSPAALACAGLVLLARAFPRRRRTLDGRERRASTRAVPKDLAPATAPGAAEEDSAEGRRAEEASAPRVAPSTPRPRRRPRAPPRARSRLVDALAVLAAGAFANRAGARGRTAATPREAARRKNTHPRRPATRSTALARSPSARPPPAAPRRRRRRDRVRRLPRAPHARPRRASPALVWSAVRRGALGELRAGVDLRDVLEQRRLLDDGGGGGGGGAFSSPTRRRSRASRAGVGPARGVSSAVVAARAEGRHANGALRDALLRRRAERKSSSPPRRRRIGRVEHSVFVFSSRSTGARWAWRRGTGRLRGAIRGVAVVNADAVPGGFGAGRLAGASRAASGTRSGERSATSGRRRPGK